MPETLDELHARLQQTKADYMRTLQQMLDVWRSQYEEMNKEFAKAQQTLLSQLAAGCAAVPPKPDKDK